MIRGGRSRLAGFGAVIGVLALAAGCAVSAPPAEQHTASPSGGSPVAALPPVFIDPTEAEGRTYQLGLDRVAVIRDPQSDPSGWRCELSPTGIVQFEPGRVESEAVYYPSLRAVATGRTAVTMTAGGTSTHFVIEVTAQAADE